MSVKDDIFLSETEAHRKNDPKTRIHHIKGYLVVNIDAKAIEQYCRKLDGRVKDIRRKKKDTLCKELVALKVADDRFGPPAAADTNNHSSNTTTNSRKRSRGVKVNYYRLINVLGLETIKPLLVAINSALSRTELDAGRKAGKDLFAAISVAYNDVLNEEIDKVKWGFGADDCDPSDYEGDLSPTQVEAAFRSLKSSYQTYRANWTLSGQHEDPFGEEIIKPFEDFVAGKMHFVYLHNLLQEQPKLLGSIYRDFDEEGIFSESTGPSTSKKRKKKKERASSASEQVTEQMVESMKERNKIIKETAEQDRKTAQATELSHLTDLRATARTTKRQAKQNLLATPKVDGDKQKMIAVLAQVRQKIGRSPPKKAPPSLSQSSIESDSQRMDFGTEFLQAEQEEKLYDGKIKGIMELNSIQEEDEWEK